MDDKPRLVVHNGGQTSTKTDSPLVILEIISSATSQIELPPLPTDRERFPGSEESKPHTNWFLSAMVFTSETANSSVRTTRKLFLIHSGQPSDEEDEAVEPTPKRMLRLLKNTPSTSASTPRQAPSLRLVHSVRNIEQMAVEFPCLLLPEEFRVSLDEFLTEDD